MTSIKFYKKNNIIIGFEVKGHTGKANYGEDLLCCQISTVSQLAIVGIREIAKCKCTSEITDGFVKLIINEKQAKEDKIQFLLQTCLESFKSIIIDEEKYAKLEVENV